MNKTTLLASFVFPERLDWFLNYLESKFNITKDKVFCYQNIDDESKLILTFKLIVQEGKRLNLKELFPNAIPIHKRGDAIYTINALNKLILKETGGSEGNIDFKSVKIDWDKFQNNLILINDGELSISKISRVF